MNRCRKCGAPIRWAKTEANRPMPLDALPNAAGNVMLDDSGRAVVLHNADDREGTRFMPHFATCPNYTPKPKP